MGLEIGVWQSTQRGKEISGDMGVNVRARERAWPGDHRAGLGWEKKGD